MLQRAKNWCARSARVASRIGGALALTMSAVVVGTGTLVPVAQALNASGVVNAYYQVSSVAAGSVTLGAGTSGAVHTLIAGDHTMLIQMTGTVAQGLGRYELLTVSSVSGSTINFSTPVTRTYDATKQVQLVWMPYDATGVTVTAAVTAAPWNGTTGGVIALGGSTLTLNAGLDATGKGYTPTSGPAASTDGGNGLTGIDFGVYAVMGGGAGGGGGVLGGGGGGGGSNQLWNYFGTSVGGNGGTAAAGGTAGNFYAGNGGSPQASGNGGSSGHVTMTPGDISIVITGAGGAGGGSYGGGGASCGTAFSAAYGAGAGGGGSYNGGGEGGLGGTNFGGAANGAYSGVNQDGHDGNTPMPAALPLEGVVSGEHYLQNDDPRLMMGGAGGNGPLPATGNVGGNGGGIVVLDFASINGAGNQIAANGAQGQHSSLAPFSAAGGGGGGQMLIRAASLTSVAAFAVGGDGGSQTPGATHTGSGGGSGGGGGIWFEGAGANGTNSGPDVGATSSTVPLGAAVHLAGVTWSVAPGQSTTVQASLFTLSAGLGTPITFTGHRMDVDAAGHPITLTYEVATGYIYYDAGMTQPVLGGSGPGGRMVWNVDYGYYDKGGRPINPKNAGYGCTPATGGVGLVRVSAPPIELGNQVWFDTNNNGTKDAGEQPVSGVTVELFVDADDNGTPDSSTPAQTTTTDGSGYYLFADLTDGQHYVVGIPPVNFAAAGALDGYWSSNTTIGATGTVSETGAPDPDNDTDNDDNGTLQTAGGFAGYVLSAPVTVTLGGEPTGENPSNATAPDANSNLTVDFGFYTTSVGNLVWNDNGIGGGNDDNGLDDGSEAGVSGVSVVLLSSDGSTQILVGPDGILGTADDSSAPVATDGSGNYTFAGLPSGSYTVRITTPSGYHSSADPVNGATPLTDDSDDNGAGTGTGAITSSSFTVTAGSVANGNTVTDATGSTATTRVDFGLVQNYDLTIDKQITSGGPYLAGATVTYTLKVTNNGPGIALDGLTVNDLLPVGLSFTGTPTSTSSDWSCAAPSGQTFQCQWNGPTSGTGNDVLASGASTSLITVNATVDTPMPKGTFVNYAKVLPSSSQSNPETNPVGSANNGYETGDPSVGSNNDDSASLTTPILISIGDFVWLDINRDGQQTPGEPFVSGVTVNLYDAAAPATIIGTTSTDGAGYYFFADLSPSHSYIVEFVAPTGDAFTTQFAAGGTTTDSNALPATGRANVTTPADGNNATGHGATDEPTIDAGLVRVDLALAKVLVTAGVVHPGDTVTFTLTPSNTGTTDALTGWKVTEVLPAGLTLVSMSGTGYTCVANVCTASAGLAAGATGNPITVTATVDVPTAAATFHNVAYISPGAGEVTEVIPLVIPTTATDTSSPATNNDAQADVTITPLVSIGDYVWMDVNRDGLQAGETAVGSVTVNLYAADGTTLLQSTSTNGSGFYSFVGLTPSTNYVVEFVKPSGTTFTTKDAGADASDSDPVVATGRVTITSPANGLNSAVTPDDPTIDAGLVKVDLALAKVVASSGPYYEGSTVTFTLTPSNVGATNALTGWSVTDIMPVGLTATGITGTGYTCVLGTLTCTSTSALAAGATANAITVTATINENFVGSAHNVAYVSPGPGEVTEVIPLITPTTSTNTSTTPTNNDAQATVSVDSLVSIGDYVWLDINRDGIQNGAEPPVSGVTVNLYASNGTTFIASTTTDNFGFYSFIDLVPGTTYVVEFVAPAGDSFTSQFSGTAANDSNANPADGRATVIAPASGVNSVGSPDDPTIDAGLVTIDLTLSKQLDTAPNYYPGKTVTYTLTPTNDGATGALAGWSVTEVVPSQLTLVSMSGTGYDCSSLPTCVSSLPLAASAAGNPITVTATINADISGLIHNVAYISPAPADVTETNPLVTPNTSTDTTTTDTNNDAQADLISDIYDLALAKIVTVTGTGEDTVLDYDITVQNQGTVDSGTYTFFDVIPAGLGVDVDSISDGGVFNSTEGTITWTLSGLAPGDSITVSWSAFVSDFSARPYRNIAEISSDGGGPWGGDNDSTPDMDISNDGDYGPVLDGTIDNQSIDDAGVGADPEDDADIADANIQVNYDLALAKSPSATTIDPAGNVVFTITVENQGDVNSENYTITDTLPAGTAASVASDGGVISGSTVTWDLTDLAPGATRQVTVTVVITDITLRPFKNIAEISADGADFYDAVVIIKGGDIEDVDSTPDTFTDNDNSTDGFDGYGTFENPTNDIDDIADVDAIPNGEDDADVAFFDAPVLYDLALITTGPAAIDGNGTATFTITILNQGNVPSGDFQVTDWVPTGLSPIAASDGGVIVGQIITWDLTGLDPGESMQITVTVNVSDFLSRPWTDTAEISGDSASTYNTDGYENPDDGVVTDDDSVPDSDPLNDVLVDQIDPPVPQYNDPAVDEDDHDVAPLDANIVYDLALVKVLPPGQSFKKGAPINFQIVVKNQGNVNSGPITVQDVIPAGLTFVSASDGGLNTGQVVTWDLADLAPGATKTVTVTVAVSTLTSYINTAEIVADGADAYDTDGSDVHDKDSTPDTDITNDPLVDTDDPNIDQVPGDEDDHDRALLDPVQVKHDNQALPPTGNGLLPIELGFGLLGAGVLALVAGRRRRRQIA